MQSGAMVHAHCNDTARGCLRPCAKSVGVREGLLPALRPHGRVAAALLAGRRMAPARTVVVFAERSASASATKKGGDKDAKGGSDGNKAGDGSTEGTQAAAPTSSAQSGDGGGGGSNPRGLSISFDNASDGEATVLRVAGPDQGDQLLSQLTGALASLDLVVMSASIRTAADGQVSDEFRVVQAKGAGGGKVPEGRWEEVRGGIVDSIAADASNSSRSGKPAIYGVAAVAELRRTLKLSSIDGTNLESDALSLESAAAELADAAASLVGIERDIARRVGETAADEGMKLDEDDKESARLEALRAEAASRLERRMAAMQAVLAARRSNEEAAAVAAAPAAADPALPKMMIEAMKAATATGGGGSQRTVDSDMRGLVTGGTPTSTGPAAGNGYEILLQGFNWESCKDGDWYKKLLGAAGNYADVGFTAVWMPPPTDSVSPQGYLPRDLYCLDSRYGPEASLRECISGLQELGLKAIADIVINHRCAHKQDEEGRWNVFGGRLAWDRKMVTCNNPEFGGAGGWKQADDYTAAPNIDHSQERVREDLKKWLKWLRNSIGYDGWRFDYVKGYEGRFTKDYVDASVPAMAFGEYWDTCEYTNGVLNYNQDAHRQRTVNWCDQTGGTAAAFDFTTKGVLQEAVQRREYWRLVDPAGRAPGMLGLWPSRAITFIENHDTGSTLQHWPFPHANTLEGYAYILTHPGTPCVFYDHFHDKKFTGPISEMVRARKRNGVHARSKLTVRKAMAEVYAATIDDRLAVKIGPGDWAPMHAGGELAGKQWKLITSGFQFAVWEVQQ